LVGSDDEGLQESPVDWGELPVLPNSFFSKPSQNTMMTPSSSHQQSFQYLDSGMQQSPLTKAEADSFAWEHALLLQSVLQLLAEREQLGVEGSVDAADNIWKKGPLKKMSYTVGRRKMRPTAGAWSVKYVELRRGNLCYYEDSGDQGRTIIHLRQHEAVVQESSKRGPGLVFELLVEGSPARYWTARSEEERQAWIRAIQAAMIGEEDRRSRELDLSPYQASLTLYKEMRESIQKADMQELYFEAIKKATMGGVSLQIPVQWVREEVRKASTPPQAADGTIKRQAPKRKNSAHIRRKGSISEFWRSMRKLSFSINGFVVPRDTTLAAERVVGSLTRCILEFDKAFEDCSSSSQNQITELQAVSYARSILLSVLQGKEQADSDKLVEDLLQGRPELVCVSSLSEEDEIGSLTRLEVSFPGEDLPDDFEEPEADYMSHWIQLARRRNSTVSVSNSKWKRRYAVLSGAVLSFYEAASPRPNGLRGQLVLNAETTVDTEEIPKESNGKSDAVMSDCRYVVVIKTSGNERLLWFAEKSDMTAWKESLQKALDFSSEAAATQRAPSERTPAKMLSKAADRVTDGSIRGGIRVIKGAKDSGMKAMKIATDGSMKAMKFATDGSMKVFRGAVERLRPSSTPRPARRQRITRMPSVLVLLDESKCPEKREPTVQCVVQIVRTFAIRAATAATSGEDENDDEEDENYWMSVQVTWYQAFLMSGGSNGRINSVEPLVVVDFATSKEEEDDDDEWVGELDVL
jgi:hypothetical protein